MALTFAAAIGSSVTAAMGQSRKTPGLIASDWSQGVLAAVGALFTLGLINQARDLWATYRRQTNLARDERWGWRYSIFWRVAIAANLVDCYVVGQLADHKLIDWPDRDAGFGFVSLSSAIRVMAVYLPFIFVASAIPRRTVQKEPTLYRRIITGLGIVTIVIFSFLYLINAQVIQYLVHLALTGCEMVGAYGDALADIDPNVRAREERFLFWALAAIPFAFINFGLVALLARQWSVGWKRRLTWGVGLCVCLGVSCVFPIWVEYAGMRSVAPFVQESRSFPGGATPKLFVFCALVGVMTAITFVAYRLAGAAYESKPNPEVATWRRESTRYYHERPLILWTVVLIGVFNTALFFRECWSNQYAFISLPRFVDVFANVVDDSTHYIPVAFFLTAFDRAWRTTFQARPAFELPRRIDIGKFCAVWMGLFLSTLIIVPTLAWFSFALYFGDWWRHF